MTLQPPVLNIDKFLNIQIQREIYILRDKLKTIINLQNLKHISSKDLDSITKNIKEAIETNNFLKKRQALIQISQLLSQFKNTDNFQIEKLWQSIIDEIDFLRRQTLVYASLLEVINFLETAEKENDLAKKFQEYVNGFELIATIVEDSRQFLSNEVCHQIEIAANTILQIELEIRQKNYETYQKFEATAKNLRRSATSTLWMLNKLKVTHKTEEFQNSQNSFKPFLKHKGETPEEQLQKNQDAMKLLKSWLEEEVSEEEAKERERQFEIFKEIVDNERPSGYKLYSKE